ncbi:MAG: cyclic pyranopterin monophosphate synthase MoaC [Vicinamibacteria bacterium]|nr:cyclic pyranopterin monophosphate synthase MoaC [Vicinamibacteria bacterium]
MGRLSHVDGRGKARMVDVGDKKPQLRIAKAAGKITLSKEALRQIRRAVNRKGDVLSTAQIAGIQAAKKTAELIPLCHTLLLDCVKVEMKIGRDAVAAESEVRSHGRTGAEMEALTAVVAALLTVYDMCKAVDKGMRIHGVRLVEKEKHDING